MTDAKTGQLGTTLATWLFMLDDAGHRPDDADLQAACDAIRSATEGADDAGKALVAVVESKLGDTDDFDAVTAWVKGLYGDDAIATSLGDDRDSRARAARAYQFKTSLPWVAQIIDRFPDGSVGPHWVMAQRVTDIVTCMDPYPWDDLDEQYEAPVIEFMVKWELAGSTCLFLQG